MSLASSLRRGLSIWFRGISETRRMRDGWSPRVDSANTSTSAPQLASTGFSAKGVLLSAAAFFGLGSAGALDARRRKCNV